MSEEKEESRYHKKHDTSAHEPSSTAEEILNDIIGNEQEDLKEGDLLEPSELSDLATPDTLDGLPEEDFTLPSHPSTPYTPKDSASPSQKTRPYETKINFFKQPTLIDNIPPPKAKDFALPIPEKIGPYKIESLFDKGGMSLLYLGIHPETKDPIIIKVLLPKYLKRSSMKKSFLKEAQIIQMADHPNIVKLHGQGEWQDGLYIAMEFIRGVSLKQFIVQQAMSLKKALEIILQTAYALCHLHVHGVIHRDLKPENILITEEGKVKVIDFGIAQLQIENEQSPQKARVMGTPAYMSPEQKNNPHQIQVNTDIYSLGIITYELILGKLSKGQIHLGLMPKGLQKILKKALQSSPKDRYQDIVEFIGDLSLYLESSELSKEVKGKDFSTEMGEKVMAAQNALLPLKLPLWPKVDIGLTNHRTLNISGVYYDFLDLPEGKHGIILGECASSKGAEGVVYTAYLKGVIRGLIRQIEDPLKLMSKINETITHDSLDQVFTLSYLILDSSANTLRYISCGFGNLWLTPFSGDTPQLIHSENIALGIEAKTQFLEVSHPWRKGDNLILNTFSAMKAEDAENKEFKAILKENLQLPAQKQTDTIMRQLKTTGSSKTQIQQRPITIIAIQRNQ